ncbi:MAG: glycosyltransferase [Prevotella sp.]|jgi:glycosyltransferase|nr:glycosyltransferase [Prevotella sp.]
MKISIITIVYNNRNCISDCIQSVINQSYDDIEYLVIDGASTDGTIDIIQNYELRITKEYPHISFRWISEKDTGLYNALNKGIRQATGDIIGILHSDDLYYTTDVLKQINKVFQSTETDLVYANGQYVEQNNTEIVKRIYQAKPFKKSYLKFGWIPLHTTIYVRKGVFDQYGLYDENYSIASDYEISLRWFFNDNIKKIFLDSWVVKMRLGGKSTTAKFQKRKSSEDLSIIRKYHLWGWFTLGCKIMRKIPQYFMPQLINIDFHLGSTKCF